MLIAARVSKAMVGRYLNIKKAYIDFGFGEIQQDVTQIVEY